MRISNSFGVPLPPEQAWATLMDIPQIVPCMPGAELVEQVDDRTFKGKVSVRLGPVALTFAGTASFEEMDAVAHRAVVKAQGTDAKGRGGANAIVNFAVTPDGTGSKVQIDTDVNLSGSVAQYGRGAGMIQSVATQLISQFAKTLEGRINSGKQAEVAAAPSVASAANAGASTGVTPQPASPSLSAAPPKEAAPVRLGPVTETAKPIGGFSLVFKALWASITGLFRRSA